MLSDVERKKREAAHFFVERLNERAGDLILKVILFGSVARGEAREESDIDILVYAKDVDKVREICADLQLETWIIFREPVEYLVYPISYLRKRLFFIGRKEVLFEMEEEEIRYEEARGLYELACEFLEGAKDNLERGNLRISLDAAYNAAELCAKALIIIAGGNIPGSHGGIVSEFGRIYVMSGEISRDIGRKLSHALEMRGRARYEASADISKEDVLIVIELAERMIKILEGRIEKMRMRLDTQ